MDNIVLLIIIGIVGLAVGFGVAKYLEKNNASQLTKSAKKKVFYSALCLVLTVRFRSLAPWGKLFQLLI